MVHINFFKKIGGRKKATSKPYLKKIKVHMQLPGVPKQASHHSSEKQYIAETKEKDSIKENKSALFIQRKEKKNLALALGGLLLLGKQFAENSKKLLVYRT